MNPLLAFGCLGENRILVIIFVFHFAYTANAHVVTNILVAHLLHIPVMTSSSTSSHIASGDPKEAIPGTSLLPHHFLLDTPLTLPYSLAAQT